MPTIPTREWKQMPFFMVAASHSPLLDFPARESSSVLNILAALEQARARIRAFDPELVILFGDRKSTRLNSSTNAHLVCRLLLEKNNGRTAHEHETRSTSESWSDQP